jgi:hypothetical protein
MKFSHTQFFIMLYEPSLPPPPLDFRFTQNFIFSSYRPLSSLNTSNLLSIKMVPCLNKNKGRLICVPNSHLAFVYKILQVSPQVDIFFISTFFKLEIVSSFVVWFFKVFIRYLVFFCYFFCFFKIFYFYFSIFLLWFLLLV